MDRYSLLSRFSVPSLPFFLFLSLLVLSLLAACSQQQSRVYHTGTEGLVLSFTPDFPKEVYEESSQPIEVLVWNKGAADIPKEQIIFSLKGDPFYLAVEQDEQLSSEQDLFTNAFQRLFPFTYTAAELDTSDLNAIHGKGDDWPEGEKVELFPLVTFKRIKGLREQPTTQLFASACYPYETRLGTTVCVDANGFNGNRQTQVCQASTLTFQSQGAPVAVTMIESRPTPLRIDADGGRGSMDVVQPVFVLHVKNVGGGAVLPLPVKESVEDRAAACSLTAVSDQPNGVTVNATLSGLQLDCDPSPIVLQQGEGFTICRLPLGERGKLSVSNYLGVFSVQLTYLYRSMISKEVAIKRKYPAEYATTANQYADDERDQDPGFINGVPRCEYCSGGHGGAGCEGWPTDVNGVEINESWQFSCVCSEKECLKKSQQGKCVFGQTWCPGTNYCCVPGR